MAKDGSPYVTCEDFEPFCQWKRLEDSDILEVHVPDFKKEELRVRVSNNSVLTISGERLLKGEDSKKVKFQREIKLSKDIYPDQIRAKFGSSVLSIIMPKKASAQKTEEVAKPKAETSDDTVVSGSKETAENNFSKLQNYISGLRSPLSRLKFGNKTAAATVIMAAIVALGAYYLTKN